LFVLEKGRLGGDLVRVYTFLKADSGRGAADLSLVDTRKWNEAVSGEVQIRH